MNGLLAAMRFFDKKRAVIITFSNSDFIEKDGFEIEVIPAHKYLIENE
jgi:predicted AAA+ superfamily ATPase